MHFFELRNIQHFVMYLFPALISVFLIGAGFAFMHFRKRNSQEREKRVYYKYPGGIEDRQEPFPLVLILIIAGTVIWVFLYILLTGLLEVKI
ncbi:MAG: hypothetical protein AMK69_11945 [Nitrospira bacterium SG8_3]|nr:MAG: hypothetical protein AMK69_11945 [Nitrospira bacterium SG8_3]